MAGRTEIQRVVTQLRDFPAFWDYVKILEAERDSAINTLLYEQQPANVEVQRGRARAFNDLIKQIYANGGANV